MSVNPDWSVGRPARRCAASGRPLVEGEACYSALREEDDKFVRLDYAEDVWPDVDRAGLFSYWKTHIPDAAEADRRRLVFDVEAFYQFYVNLDGATDPGKARFRGVLALMLARRRVLRLDGIDRRPDGHVLRVYDRRRECFDEVPEPSGTPAELEAAEAELRALLET